jgi:hypothetical protein
MSETTAQPATPPTPAPRLFTEAELETFRGRLGDRGIDPRQVLGTNELGDDVSVASFYGMLGRIAATEKAGQGPTFAMARLALKAGLPNEIADTLFLAYNQQSAEEAGHGDKVFGNAYYALGGHAPAAEQSAVGNGTGPNPDFLRASDDPKRNKQLLAGIAGVLGGIETVALNRVFPFVVTLGERWDHPIARDLLAQIRDTVRPEESRHVLNWRYVFHHMVAPKGDAVVDGFLGATNSGRRMLGSPEFDRETIMRMLGTSAPTPRQLLGKDRSALI